MTREEFYKKYGDVEVKFYSYYKYSFHYCATLDDGSILTCVYGGDSDSIYRHEVANDAPETVMALMPYAGNVHLDGVSIESFYDF